MFCLNELIAMAKEYTTVYLDNLDPETIMAIIANNMLQFEPN